MTRHKNQWVNIDELPEQVRMMLKRFTGCFGYGSGAYVITYYREDAVFVQMYGGCNAYLIARFIAQNPGIYIEISASAYCYWTLRMFCSRYLIEHEVDRRSPWIGEPHDDGIVSSVRVREGARE